MIFRMFGICFFVFLNLSMVDTLLANAFSADHADNYVSSAMIETKMKAK